MFKVLVYFLCDSYFVWVGSVFKSSTTEIPSSLAANLSNLVLTMENRYEKDFPMSTNILNEDEFNCNLAEAFGRVFCRKLSKPVIFSCDFKNGLTPEEQRFLQTEIMKKLKAKDE